MLTQKDRFKSRALFWLCLSCLLGLLACVRFLAEPLTSFFYERGILQALNISLSAFSSSSLESYQFHLKHMFWGPLTVVLGTLVFILLGLRYWTLCPWWALALAVFVYFIVIKFEVLFFPPYGDTIGGPFQEALWLANNGFDYAGLFEQPGYSKGGPKVYLFSIYPAYLAVLLKMVPLVKLFLAVNHLLAFACGAVIIALFRDIVLKMTDPKTAFLLSTCLLSLPLFQSQTEAISMEIPLLLFTMLSVYYLAEKRLWPACGMAVFAVLIKGFGIVACASAFSVCLVLFLFDAQHRFRLKALAAGLVCLLFAAFLTYVSMVWLNEPSRASLLGLFKGVRLLRYVHEFKIFAGCLIIAVSALCYLKIKKGGAARMREQLVSAFYVPVIAFICVLFWFALFINSSVIIPRYQLTLMPFLMVCVLACFNAVIPFKKVQQAGIGLVTVLFLCSSYGLWHMKLRVYDPNSDHITLERSLEYRRTLELSQKLAEHIERHYDRFIIGAPHLVAMMLALPELGYVQKDLDVMMYGFQTKNQRIKNFFDWHARDIHRTVWVTIEADQEKKGVFDLDYPLGPKDKVIDTVVAGDRRAVLFVGGFEIYRRWASLINNRQNP